MIYKAYKGDYKNGSLSSHKKLVAFISDATQEDMLIINKASDAHLSANGWLDLISALEAIGADLHLAGKKLSVDITFFQGFKVACMGLADSRKGSKPKGNYKGRKPVWEANLELVRKYRSQGLKPTHIAQKLGIGRSTVFKCIEYIKANEDQLGLDV